MFGIMDSSLKSKLKKNGTTNKVNSTEAIDLSTPKVDRSSPLIQFSSPSAGQWKDQFLTTECSIRAENQNEYSISHATHLPGGYSVKSERHYGSLPFYKNEYPPKQTFIKDTEGCLQSNGYRNLQSFPVKGFEKNLGMIKLGDGSHYAKSRLTLEQQQKGNAQHRCSYCNFITNDANEMKVHIIVFHDKEKPEVCPHCDYRCMTLGGKKLHLTWRNNIRIENVVLWHCPFCNYSTIPGIKIMWHLMVFHTKMKPYVMDPNNYTTATINGKRLV